MKNKEIMEGLAHCFNTAEYSNCNDCPYRDTIETRCTHALYKDVVDLINRQQAEVNILKSELNDCDCKNYDLENRIAYTEAAIPHARAEGIKKVVERSEEQILRIVGDDVKDVTSPELIKRYKHYFDNGYINDDTEE